MPPLQRALVLVLGLALASACNFIGIPSIAAQESCQDGSHVTISGNIERISARYDGGFWIGVYGRTTPCNVLSVFMGSRRDVIQLPPSCVDGADFTAEGVASIQIVGRAKVVAPRLFATNITCRHNDRREACAVCEDLRSCLAAPFNVRKCLAERDACAKRLGC
jgi:hypothetical protein